MHTEFYRNGKLILSSMQFVNFNVHQKINIWDTFKLAIGYDIDVTT
jgi:hypothetical protein